MRWSSTLTKPRRSQTGQPGTHIHIWLIDSHNIGTCSLCGEVRQFPWERGSPVIVLKKGDPSISQVKVSQVKPSQAKPSQVKPSQLKEDDMATNNFEKHRHYEEHKEEILADLRSIGRPATCKKWKISSSTIHTLEKRWLTPQESKDLTERSNREGLCRESSTSQPTTTPTNNLPPFPEFSNEWPESVQLKWFELYAQLSRPTSLYQPSSP
jgi:hypothetical protein